MNPQQSATAPHVNGKIQIGFESEGRVIPIDHLLPLRTIPDGTRSSIKYRRIAASIAQVGVIEPLVVYPQNGKNGKDQRFLIVDGLLRYDILKSNGESEVFCLI